MTLRSAASLVLLGAALVALVLVVGLVLDLLLALQGLIPVSRLVISLIYSFASVTAVVFLHVFRKTQP